MRNPFDTTIAEETRKAKRALYLVVNACLAFYGAVILVRGMVDLYDEKGTGLLLNALGVAGLRLWLRWKEPWLIPGNEARTEECL